MTRLGGSWPWWRWSLTGLSALGLGLSAYLAWHFFLGGTLIGCGGRGSAGCEKVLGSRWSALGGVVPVSGLAAGVYLAMFLANLSIGPATAAPVRRLAWSAMLVLAGAVAGSAVWFTIVQRWAIGAFCIHCLATHLTGVSLAALVIWRAPRHFDDESTAVGLAECSSAPPVGADVRANAASSGTPRRVAHLLPLVGRVLAGLALAGVLAAFQVAFIPTPAYQAGHLRENLPPIDRHTAPLAGSPEAPYIVNLLFDYTCPHCQRMHFLLNEVIRRYRGKLAFGLCPAPLSRQCNPYFPEDGEEFKDACELAKVGLAVWVANREAYPAFDHWMFSFESGDRWQPRSLETARLKAVELVGQAKFETSRGDPWVDRYLQTSIRLFGQSGSNAVPKLVLGSRWVIPQVEDADGLITILQGSLALPGPSASAKARRARSL